MIHVRRLVVDGSTLTGPKLLETEAALLPNPRTTTLISPETQVTLYRSIIMDRGEN